MSDWLAAGNTIADLLVLVTAAEGNAAPDGAGAARVEDDDWPTPETLTDALLAVKSLTPRCCRQCCVTGCATSPIATRGRLSTWGSRRSSRRARSSDVSSQSVPNGMATGRKFPISGA